MKMKLNIVSTTNTEKGSVVLPKQFDEPIRSDLIKRAVLAIQSNRRQPYGANPEAGKRASAFVSKRRHKYKSTYGIGQSRTPRKVMSFRGTRFNWVGAFAPQTVGGRRAHPPKAEKVWSQKINTQERRKAIRSAMAATLYKTIVSERGHIVPDNYPFILSKDFEKIEKTKDLKRAFEKVGMKEDLERADYKKIRAGRGTFRGRRYKTKKSLLLVTASDCPALKAADNILGVDAVSVEDLNAELLAPGTNMGRMTLFTEGAIERLAKEDLFLRTTKRPKAESNSKSRSDAGQDGTRITKPVVAAKPRVEAKAVSEKKDPEVSA